MLFNRDDIRYVERLIREIGIPWSKEGATTYISINNHIFNLLGYMDLLIFTLFNYYIEVDSRNGKETITPFDADLIGDIYTALNQIETNPSIKIGFKR